MTSDLYVPFTAPFAANENNSWGYETTPQLFSLFAYPSGVAPITQGKVMGGTGSLNSMNYVRGNPKDFDKWENEYNATGWKYSDVLSYFKEIENFNISDVSEEDKRYHGYGGETPVNYPGYYTNLSYVFLDACKEADYEKIDYNGEHHTGYSRVESNTAYGVRWGPSSCFLNDTVRARSNLHIFTKSIVIRILFEQNRTTGVIFTKDGENKTVKVKREVILCAGAIGSPKLLMLSGIGPDHELARHNIKRVQVLPVGQALQDHIIFLGLVVTTTMDMIGLGNFNKSIEEYNETRTGLLTIPGAFEALLFTSSKEDKSAETEDYPDIELELAAMFPNELIGRSPYVDPAIYEKYYKPMFGKAGFMNAVAMVQPKSRGTVHLTSTNPYERPQINPNMLYYTEDLERIVNGTLKVMKLFNTAPMKAIGAEVWNEKFPYCNQFDIWSRDYVTCFVQHTAFPGQHVCCTAPMGTHKDAVVDERLRVHGINGLRVMDASVMPAIVSGNTYAAVLMIGAKGADMVLKDAEQARY
ncbi:hypothetical protein V5799_020688 [Amblyomma americanum]|uniref:Glucose-methanol-choline oxidoreductase N-terminal domain-containing protein n=1 Tax=Amblyomma americanum TaxID=6943 RepID=A0AAQ4ET95_AMBAM